MKTRATALGREWRFLIEASQKPREVDMTATDHEVVGNNGHFHGVESPARI
jgi:hypothetical protein